MKEVSLEGSDAAAWKLEGHRKQGEKLQKGSKRECATEGAGVSCRCFAGG